MGGSCGNEERDLGDCFSCTVDGTNGVAIEPGRVSRRKQTQSPEWSAPNRRYRLSVGTDVSRSRQGSGLETEVD